MALAAGTAAGDSLNYEWNAYGAALKSGDAKAAVEHLGNALSSLSLIVSSAARVSSATLSKMESTVPGLAAKFWGATVTLPKEIIALSEANIKNSGITVLGSYPGYINKAIGNNLTSVRPGVLGLQHSKRRLICIFLTLSLRKETRCTYRQMQITLS